MTADRSPETARPVVTETDRIKRRSAAVVTVATLIAGAGFFAGFGFWTSDRASAVETALRDEERRLAEVEAKRTSAETALAALEAKRAETERAVADNSRRVAQLDERREKLQLQVAELAGPVSAKPDDAAPEDDAPQPRPGAADDPSPPDEAVTEPLARTAAIAPTASASDAPPPVSAPVRVFIHVQSSDTGALERARAVASELKRQGVEVADIRGVRLPIRRDALRYFYDADREAVGALEQAVRRASSPAAKAPQAQDFRGFRAAPRQGTIELWLS